MSEHCPHNRSSARACTFCQTQMREGDRFKVKFPKQAVEAKQAQPVPVSDGWTKVNKKGNKQNGA